MDIPKPVKTESRICFGLAWFTSEEDAQLYHNYVREQGFTYNGGYYHGRLCGRLSSFDYEDPQFGKLYAVTH